MRIKPAPGLQVRDPQTKQLIASEGHDVPDFDLYWSARLRDGDVVLVSQEAAPVKSDANISK